MNQKEYKNIAEFYPFYLSQHSLPINRFLHVFGTSLGLILGIAAALSTKLWLIPLGLVAAYTCAWVGHFVFEKNRPATFKYPLLSFCCDFIMLKDFFTGKLEQKIAATKHHQ